jgi:hypothetical protein
MSKNNLPEKVYILQFKGDDNKFYFNHSWEDKNITGKYTEYIRADIAEQMAKKFHSWIRKQLYQECECEEACDILTYYHPFDPDVNTYTLDELFIEFTNSRSK